MRHNSPLQLRLTYIPYPVGICTPAHSCFLYQAKRSRKRRTVMKKERKSRFCSDEKHTITDADKAERRRRVLAAVKQYLEVTPKARPQRRGTRR